MSVNRAIRAKSPHLAGSLEKILTPAQCSELDEVWNYVVQAGGMAEIGFEREPGVSYNPRPARVGLILLSNFEVTEVHVIAAGFLSCVDDSVAYSGALAKDATKLAERSKHSIRELAAAPENDEVLLVALARHLDDVRHFHLRDGYREAGFASERERFLQLTEEHARAVPMRYEAVKQTYEKYIERWRAA